jgi:hypothetical protein
MTDVAAQILAKITALEDVARAAAEDGHKYASGDWWAEGSWWLEGTEMLAVGKGDAGCDVIGYTYTEPIRTHIAANDPAHVLRLCAALGAVVELHAAEYATCADETWGHNATCATCRGPYPCPTLSAVAGVWGVSGVDA